MILIVLACESADPRLEALGGALQAWDEGRAALEAGQSSAAEAAFLRAAEKDPNSPEPWLWLGEARARAQDWSGAAEAASEAVNRGGGSLALYNRACWRARAGQLDGAAADLALALQDPSIDRFTVAMDPDLEALRDRPGFPRAELPTASEVPAAPTFLGSDLSVVMSVLHPEGALSVSGPDPGLFQLRRVVEERAPEGSATRTLVKLTLRAVATGEAQLGPWTVQVGALKGTIPGGPVSVLGPEGVAGSPGVSSILLPSALLEGGPRRLDDRLVVVPMEPGDRVEWTPEERVQLELREGGVPLRVGEVGALAPGQAVRVLRGERVVWEGAP